MGSAGLPLDTIVYHISRRGTEYTCNENALHQAYSNNHHELLHAKNYSFVPVVTDTSGALNSASLRLLYASRQTPLSSAPSRTP
jgi:hypothetical protein